MTTFNIRNRDPLLRPPIPEAIEFQKQLTTVPQSLAFSSNLLWICCTTCCTTNPQQIEQVEFKLYEQDEADMRSMFIALAADRVAYYSPIYCIIVS
jgi:hypothetical protein